MKINYKKIVLIGVLVIAVLVISLVLFSSRRNLNTDPEETATTQTDVTPDPVYTISYDNDKADQLIEIVKNRPQLTEEDARLRQILITSLEQKNNLWETPLFKLSHLKTFDFFEIEITTPEINQARQSATEWFTQKGFSQEGLCHLPVSFLVSPDVTLEENTIVNQLPDGC